MFLGDLENAHTLDLHGYGWQDGLTACDEYAHHMLKVIGRSSVIIITGQGHHSPDQVGVIKIGFIDLMKGRGYKLIEVNPGCFRCTQD